MSVLHTSEGTGTARPVPTALLLSIAWFALALLLGQAGAFTTAPGTPPVAIGLAAAGPPLAALALLVWSPRLRAWARSRDLRLLTTLQAWRTGGLAFLALAAVSRLPAGFALPAGLGDVAVGLTAPLVAALVGRAALSIPAYLGWSTFGILDLATAVTLGVLYSATPVGLLTDGRDTAVMAQLPMSLVPTFFVPLLLIVHMISLVAAPHRLRP